MSVVVRPDDLDAEPAGADPRGQPRGFTRRRPDGRWDSVQWIQLSGLPGLPLTLLERRYHRWSGTLLNGLVAPRWSSEGAQRLSVGFAALAGWPVFLQLGARRLEPGRLWRPLERGLLLAAPGGEFAIEMGLDDDGQPLLKVAVRGIAPRLPTPLYRLVQRRLHERVTYAFLREVRAGVSPGGRAGTLGGS